MRSRCLRGLSALGDMAQAADGAARDRAVQAVDQDVRGAVRQAHQWRRRLAGFGRGMAHWNRTVTACPQQIAAPGDHGSHIASASYVLDPQRSGRGVAALWSHYSLQ